MKSNNEISNARYYANAAEQQILIQGLQRYFTLPERSQNRNKITKEVSQFLRCFSPHWSHRAVRLWFNNNKHSYFNAQNQATENINNPVSNIPTINNNIPPNINNQNFETLTPNNANIILSGASYLKMPLSQVPNQVQPASALIPGIQYPNFKPINEKGDSYSIQAQGNVLQTLGAIAPTIQNLIPPSISLKDQQHQKIKQENKPQPPPKLKQQLIVPQINTNSVSQCAPLQMKPPNPTSTQISTSIMPQQPSSFELKVPPKIPQPQILPNANKPASSPIRFQRIPTPQIDGTLYSESSNNNNNLTQSPNQSSGKKKVTVMPPIQISPVLTKQTASNSSNSSFSYWPNNSPSNFGKGSSLEGGTTRERMCKQITALLKEIRETPEEPMNPNSLLKMKINEFERMCSDFRSQFGFLSPQIIDPSFKFTRFPVHDPLREMPVSLSSLSFSILSTANMNDDNDGYGGDLNGFMYNDMGSIGSLSAFGRSDSNFSLNTFSPSTSMNLINDNSVNSQNQIQDNSLFDIGGAIQNSGREESLSNFEIFEKVNDGNKNANNYIKNGSKEEEKQESSKGRTYTYSSSPSFTPSSSSSIDASMSTPLNTSTALQPSTKNDSQNINSNINNGTANDTDGGFSDHISPNSIWQARSFKFTHIPYFECTALSRGLETAAYVYKHIDFNSNQNQRAICFTNRNDGDDSIDTMHDSWKTIMVDCQSVIESMVIDCESAWLLSNCEIVHSSLLNKNDNSSVRIELPQNTGSRFLSLIGNSGYCNGCGVVACSSSSSDLFFVNENDNHELQIVSTSCNGISCIAALSNEKIACAVPLNGTITLVDKNGSDIRSFVGHCGPVMGIYPLFSSGDNFETNLFASRADDNTVRIWDIRERIPLFQITTSLSLVSNAASSNSQSSIANQAISNKNGSSMQHVSSSCSFLNVGGNDQYLMFALHGQIGVVDIRKDFAKPILSVSTDDYDAVSLCYNQDLNSVAMFGEIGNRSSKDSMLFVGNDGQSRKRIFRTYSNFIG